MLTLKALLDLCDYSQRCLLFVAGWEAEAPVESLQGILADCILDLPVIDIGCENDLLKIWLKSDKENLNDN